MKRDLQIALRVAARLYSWRQWLATAGVLVFAAWFFYGVVFGTNGTIAYRQKVNEYKQLQKDVQQSQAENERLQQRIKGLKTDPQAIEKEAREQFRYARPGELIYVLPAPKAPAEPPAMATAQKR
jgi:cell division protein FtsB